MTIENVMHFPKETAQISNILSEKFHLNNFHSPQARLTISGLHQLGVAVLGGLSLGCGARGPLHLDAVTGVGVVGVAGDIWRGGVVLWDMRKKEGALSSNRIQVKLCVFAYAENCSYVVKGVRVKSDDLLLKDSRKEVKVSAEAFKGQDGRNPSTASLSTLLKQTNCQ